MRLSPIAIIGAMNEEIDLYLENITQQIEHHRAGIKFIQGIFFNQEVIICKSGVGKVNAAVVTQILIDQFHVKQVIFTGVAGALAPFLEVGDVVISNSCMHHDLDVTALGFARGEIPYQSVSIFLADQHLVRLAHDAGEQLFPDRVHIGRILSGDQFISDRQKVEILHHELEGLCAEMEGAAVAQVCNMNNIPYVVIRSMSDKADGTAHLNFIEFTKQASMNSFKIVCKVLKNIL